LHLVLCVEVDETMSQAIDPRSLRPSRDDEPTGALIREAIDEAGTLARLEVALAREEIHTEIARMRSGVTALASAAAAALAGVVMLLAAIALAFVQAWLVALILGGILFVCAAAAGLYGWRALPKRPMNGTRERLESDLKQLRERIA
jgi:hypothetical protein